MCADSNFVAGALAPDAVAAEDKEALDAAAFPYLPLCSTS